MGYRTTDLKGVEGPASATDNSLVLFDGTSGEAVKNQTTITYASGALILTGTGSAIKMDERTTPPTTSAGEGSVYVQDDTDPSAEASTLWFGDDAGNLIRLGADSYISSNASTATAAANPGPGTFRFNNAAAGSATEIYISTGDVHGLGYGNIWFKSLNPGSQMIFIREDYPNDRFRFWVDAVIDEIGWARIQVDNTKDAQSPAWSGLQNGERYIIALFSNVADIEGGINPMDATFFTERADHVNTFPNPGFAELWVKNDTPNTLIFTDDAATDWYLALSDTAGLVLESGVLSVPGSVTLVGTDSDITVKEHTSAPGTPSAGFINFYAKADGLLYSKDDGGTERLVNDDAFGIGTWYDTGASAAAGDMNPNNAACASTTSITFFHDDINGRRVRNLMDSVRSGDSVMFVARDRVGSSITFTTTGTSTTPTTFTISGMVNTNNVGVTDWVDADGWGLSVIPTTASAGGVSTASYWEYDSTTTAGSGGAGTFRFNNATATSATAMYFDDEDLDGTGTRAPLGYLQPGQHLYLVKEDDRTQRLRIQPSSSSDDTTYATVTFSTYSPTGSTSWTNPTDGDRFYLEFGPISHRGGGAPALWTTARAAAPGGSTGAGKFFTRTDGANTALPEQTPWFTNDDARDIRLGMQSVSISGEVSPTTGSTWYSWGSAGPYNDTLWGDNVGTGTAPTTSNWFTRPPLILIPGDANIERVVGWYQSESASVGTWEMELVAVAIEDADTTVGTVDPIVDGSVNSDFSVTDAKITLLSHTINDRSALPTDTNHMIGLYMAFQETTGTALNVDLRFNVTIYWSTYTTDGWVSDGFAAS